MIGQASFTRLKSSTILGAQKRKEKEKESSFSTIKLPHLIGTRNGGGGLMGLASLITPLNLGGTRLLTGTWVPYAWQINGKVIFPVTTGYTGHMFGTCFGSGKKPPLCGPFGTRWWQPMNEGLALLRPPFPNNALFVFLT